MTDTVLVLRTSDKNRKAHSGFQWPESGLVECPDWNPRAECGNGLHGILWPEGNWGDIKDYGGNETWQVVKVAKSDLVEIGGKVKFPKGEVVYSGTFAVAFNMVAKKWLDQLPTWTKTIQDEAKAELKDGEVDSGNYAQIGSSGDSAQIGSSGNYAQIGSSGDSAQIGSSGYSARIGSSGDSAQIGSSGNYAQIGSSGDSAQIGSSGYSARIGSSGYSARIGSSGYSAQIGSSGNYARIGSSGDSAQIGSSGNSARIGSSGYSARIGSSGYSARIGSSGDSARIDANGEKAVIACAGSVERFKAGANGCIAAPWWDEKAERTRFAVGYVGENIKADTWYTVNESGEFVEIE